jgi:hypothetical protein
MSWESVIVETWRRERNREIAKRDIAMADRVVFLNALPLNAMQSDYFTIDCVRFDNALVLKELAEHLKGKTILNYIRHESTVKLISRLVGLELKPTAGLYEHKGVDAMIIATLKRPIRGVEVEVEERDLEIYVCTAWYR